MVMVNKISMVLNNNAIVLRNVDDGNREDKIAVDFFLTEDPMALADPEMPQIVR